MSGWGQRIGRRKLYIQGDSIKEQKLLVTIVPNIILNYFKLRTKLISQHATRFVSRLKSTSPLIQQQPTTTKKHKYCDDENHVS